MTSPGEEITTPFMAWFTPMKVQELVAEYGPISHGVMELAFEAGVGSLESQIARLDAMNEALNRAAILADAVYIGETPAFVRNRLKEFYAAYFKIPAP